MAQKITDYSKRRPTSLFFSSIPTTENCPFKKLIDTWLNQCTGEGLSPRTIYDYSDKLARFWWWWTAHTGYAETTGPHPKNITDKHLREFAAYLREANTKRWGVAEGKEILSPHTVAGYGRAVKAFFSWLEREQYIERTPFNRSIRFSPRNKERVIKSVSQQDLTRIFKTLMAPDRLCTFAGIRDLAMISLLLDSGMRKGELLSLELSDLDLPLLRCTTTGKTGLRYAYFSEQCKGLLLDYLKYRTDFGDSGLLWLTVDGERLGENSFGSVIRRLEDKSGVKFHAHQFRHTFAVMMSSRVSTFELMEMLGHSNITTTQMYVKNNPDRVGQAHRFNSPLNTLQDELPGLRRRGRPRKLT